MDIKSNKRIAIHNIDGEFAALSVYEVDAIRKSSDEWTSHSGKRAKYRLIVENDNIGVFEVTRRNYELEPESETTDVLIEIMSNSGFEQMWYSCKILVEAMLEKHYSKQQIMEEFRKNVKPVQDTPMNYSWN